MYVLIDTEYKLCIWLNRLAGFIASATIEL